MAKRFERSRQAPYVSVEAFRKFLRNARVTSKPDVVDEAFLEKLELKGGTVWELLPALRFLGIVDQETDAPTELYSVVYLPDQQQKPALSDAIRSAYSDLFTKLDVENARREELVTYFRLNYSPKLAERQARTFVSLSEDAGLSLSSEAASRPRGKPEQRRTVRKPPPPRESTALANVHLELKRRYIEALIKRIETADPSEVATLMQQVEKLMAEFQKQGGPS